MDYLDWIIKIGTAVTAVTGIVVLIRKIILYFVKLSEKITETMDYVSANIANVNEIKDIKRHTYENYLTGLRLTVMSENMPLGERIIAGRKYIEEGGNGEVKKYIEKELHINEIHKD